MHLKYCSNCGEENTNRKIGGQKRFYCLDCDIVHYKNPKPTATLVCPRESDILFVKQAFEPAKGSWCLLDGFMELNESIQEASVRELVEETGLTGNITRLLGTCSHFNTVFGDVLLFGMVLDLDSYDEIHIGDDAADAKHFPLQYLPTLAFPCHKKIVDMYKESMSITKYQRL